MMSIEIWKTYRDFRLDISLYLEEVAGTVLFGPSGSGKTLTMNCIAGLVKPAGGKILFRGNCFFDSSQKINVPARERHIGYMFQDYALFPHLTVLQNVAYPHSGFFGRYLSKKNIAQASAWLEKLNIAHLKSCRPDALSGGQKQRTALARALNASPGLLMLDEPFNALDPLLREQLRKEIKAYLREFAIPSIIITHDPDDVEEFCEQLVLYERGSARLIRNYKELRQDFPDTSTCLRHLQKEFQEELRKKKNGARE